MKKTILALIIALPLLFNASVQAQKFNAGVIAGAVFSQVDAPDEVYQGFHQLGYTAGFYANLPFDEYWSAQMELKYSLFGAHSSDKEVNEYAYSPYSLRLHYAEIPLMLRCNLGTFRLSFLTLEAGVSLDFRMRATEDVDGDYQVTTPRWNFFSATANAGVHFALNKHLGAGARFMYSIVPIRFSGYPGWFYNQYYNKVIQLTLTYNINSPLQ